MAAEGTLARSEGQGVRGNRVKKSHGRRMAEMENRTDGQTADGALGFLCSCRRRFICRWHAPPAGRPGATAVVAEEQILKYHTVQSPWSLMTR